MDLAKIGHNVKTLIMMMMMMYDSCAAFSVLYIYYIFAPQAVHKQCNIKRTVG